MECDIIQNYGLLIDQIPDSLLNLHYGLYPDNKYYNIKRFIYNKLFNYFPLVIFYPKTSKDIIYILREMVKEKLLFSIRCGGHAYEPASLSNSYIIDVSKINSIRIDSVKKTIMVGSGVKLGQLVSELKKYKMITATGDSSCVGISGLSLAGGKGILTRLCGMVCDNIVSLQIINGDGNLLKVDENNYSDLLWACKGAGVCNFGLVYSIELKLYSDMYCNIRKLTWTIQIENVEVIGDILKLYQTWILEIPKYITTDLNITYNNGNASFTIKFYKLSEKINEVFDDYVVFLDIGDPSVVKCDGWYSQITDCWLNTNSGYSQPFSKMKSSMIFQTNVSDKYINIYVLSIKCLLMKKLNIVFQYNFTQAGGNVKCGNSCYYPKHAIIILTIFCTWTTQNLTRYCITLTNVIHKKIIKYTSKYSFPNMIDYSIDDYMESYYGDNKNILMDIKKKYDPNNIFKWRQSIPVI